MPFVRLCGKIWYSQTGQMGQYDTAHALYMPHKEGKNRDTHTHTHTHTQNVEKLLLSHCNNCYSNTP